MRRIGMCSDIEHTVSNESDHNPEPEQTEEPNPTPDPRLEVMRQIRRALILAGTLSAEESAGGGFDPYNKHGTTSSDSWRVRRRD